MNIEYSVHRFSNDIVIEYLQSYRWPFLISHHSLLSGIYPIILLTIIVGL